jgi:hypothetical protein
VKIDLYREILEKIQISTFMKIGPLEAELFHVDGSKGG